MKDGGADDSVEWTPGQLASGKLLWEFAREDAVDEFGVVGNGEFAHPANRLDPVDFARFAGEESRVPGSATAKVQDTSSRRKGEREVVCDSPLGGLVCSGLGVVKAGVVSVGGFVHWDLVLQRTESTRAGPVDAKEHTASSELFGSRCASGIPRAASAHSSSRLPVQRERASVAASVRSADRAFF